MTTTKRMTAQRSQVNQYVAIDSLQNAQNAQSTAGWSKRSLALGIGAGMLLATLIIGVCAQFQPQAPSGANSGQTATPSDWKQAAAQAGMVVLTQQELNQQLDAAKATAIKQQASVAAKQPPQTVHVYIQPGMSTTDVAILLQAAGVLENGNALINLRQSQVNPIRAGVYDLPLKADPQAVMKTISTPPKQ